MNPRDSYRDHSSASGWSSSPKISSIAAPLPASGSPHQQHQQQQQQYQNQQQSRQNSFQSPNQPNSMPSRTDSFKSENSAAAQSPSMANDKPQAATAAASATAHDNQLLAFVGRFRDLQTHRDSSDDLVKDVLVYCQGLHTNLQNENERLSSQLHNCKLDLVDATNSRREFQQRLHKAESQADWMMKENNLLKNRNPYVLVMIDGDGLIFQDSYVKQGLEGGKRAAYALRAAIEEQCGSQADDIEIIAKVIANQGGLAKALSRAGCIENTAEFKEFTLGFNQAKASFDFIDVGYGKERTDSKIREITRWHLKNYNCKHIVLGIAHDAGYAPFLDEIIRDESTRQRLTLIEGPTVANGIAATGVQLVQLDKELFRAQKLVELSSPTVSTAPPTATASIASSSPAVQRTASPATSVGSANAAGMSYATITSSHTPPPPPPQITLPLAGKQNKQASKEKVEKPVYQKIPPEQPDWNPGQRGLDDAITVNVAVYENVKKRKESDKLCNNHFLRGPCAKGDACFFVHEYKPTDEELNAIAVLARQNPCTQGQYCENEECIYGHHCPSIRDAVCTHPFCRFDEEQHPPGTKFSAKSRH